LHKALLLPHADMPYSFCQTAETCLLIPFQAQRLQVLLSTAVPRLPGSPELPALPATDNDTHTLVSSGADLMAAGTEPDS
jgi:hypothetical protein